MLATVWWTKIWNEGLKNSEAVIVVISKFSIESKWVREELNTAFVKKVYGQIRLIPLRLDECEMPECLLPNAFGPEWSAGKLSELVSGSDSLEQWLQDSFFDQHCQIFDQRPFVWHIWEGRKDGFQAFVNYHKLAAPNGEGRKTLERLIYASLGDWIRRQEDEVKNSVDGEGGRLAAAKHLQQELIKIINGEPPYDIFVRWKPLHEQPMGWKPDINDGVRLNIRPWLNAKPYQAPNQKLKQGACILRVTPIKLPLGKDRGKEPERDREDFPLFADTQDRTNDVHLSLETKRKARERRREEIGSR